MQKIHPCLWFNNQAEEATRLYTSLFENSGLGRTALYSASSAKTAGQKEGAVLTIEFELGGLKMLALNGGPHFKSTPATSLFVWCDSEAEIDRLWKALSPGGQAHLDLAPYPWAPKYGWTSDRFGVEWQLMLPATGNEKSGTKHKIAPALLFVDQLFGKGDEAIRFYQSIFEDSKTEFIARDEAAKTVMHCVFTLAGTPFVLMEGSGEHHYTFSPAFSLMISCKDQEEMDQYWEKLSHVPEAEHCGWLQDKYGVSWQVVPDILGELTADPSKADRVMAALIQMKELDIEKLLTAAK